MSESKCLVTENTKDLETTVCTNDHSQVVLKWTKAPNEKPSNVIKIVFQITTSWCKCVGGQCDYKLQRKEQNGQGAF